MARLKIQVHSCCGVACSAISMLLISGIFLQDGELGTWEETESAWSGEAMEDLTWEAESTVRANRKSEREERRRSQEQKKRERDATRHVGQGSIAVKLS